MTTTELAAGYGTYTDEFEVNNAREKEVLDQSMPTTTVLTTSVHCWDIED
jgi:hypothetical protein